MRAQCYGIKVKDSEYGKRLRIGLLGTSSKRKINFRPTEADLEKLEII